MTLHDLAIEGSGDDSRRRASPAAIQRSTAVVAAWAMDRWTHRASVLLIGVCMMVSTTKKSGAGPNPAPSPAVTSGAPSPASSASRAAQASQASQASQARSAAAMIEGLIEAGKIDEARSAAREMLAKRPDDPEAHLAMARVLFESSKAAARAAKASSTGSPTTTGANAATASSAATQTSTGALAADLDQALDHVNGVIQGHPALLRARLLRGLILARQGKNAQASVDLAAVREAMLRPGDLALLADGFKAIEALEDEKSVLDAMVPGYPWPPAELLFRRARVLIHEHRDKEAIALLREAQRQGGDDARTRFHIGRAMEEGGDPAGALAAYRLTLETQGPAEFLEKARKKLAAKGPGGASGAPPASGRPPPPPSPASGPR